jgi:ABC-2 type transport system permease protein
MPDVVRWMRDLLPSSYGVDAFAETYRDNPDWMSVAGNLAVCAAVGVATLALATWAFRRSART